MPLPTDPNQLKLSKDLIAQFKALFGSYPGFRPAHAKGLLLTGYFIPSPSASALSSAPHFSQTFTPSADPAVTSTHAVPVPITARFSSSTGCPAISDTDPNANPRGLAIRFNLGTNPENGHRMHTDIIAHSIPLFPTRTGEEFLEMLQAIEASSKPSDTEGPPPIVKFLQGHPTAKTFAEFPKPFPTSLAQEHYFGVNAFKFINDAGVETFGRYVIEPIGGASHITPEEIAADKLGENYLYDDLKDRIRADKRAILGGAGGAGGGGVEFHIRVQIAAENDVTDNATVQWTSENIVDLGRVFLTDIVGANEAGEEEGVNEENAEEQKKIIFDPIPRVKGIEPSNDPLLELRAAVYIISGKERRAVDVASFKEKLGRTGVEA